MPLDFSGYTVVVAIASNSVLQKCLHQSWINNYGSLNHEHDDESPSYDSLKEKNTIELFDGILNKFELSNNVIKCNNLSKLIVL